MDGTVSGTFGEVFARMNQWSFWGGLLALAIAFATFNGLRDFVADKVLKDPNAQTKAGAIVLGVMFGGVMVILLISDAGSAGR